MESPDGFTLIELLVALALLAIAGSLATPTFRLLQLDAVRTREVNQFVQAVHLARGEALKRNVVVSLCPSADARDCAPPAPPGRPAGSCSRTTTATPRRSATPANH